MSKCISTNCKNEGWAAEPVPGATFCYSHWNDALSAIAQEKTELGRSLLYRSAGKLRTQKVYFLRSSGHIKIGHSLEPVDRLRAIRSGLDKSAIPATVSRAHIDCIGFVPGDHTLELELHKRFDRYRVHGEWFIAAPEVVDHINELLAAA